MQFKELPNKTKFGVKITAIIYCRRPQVNGKQFLKYTYVDNSHAGLQKFINFARAFPTAEHINFYNKETNEFIEQFKF